MKHRLKRVKILPRQDYPISESGNITMTLLAKASENKLLHEDRAIHDWYRFVLSFPPHLVRQYVDRFRITGKHTVLDPFVGTGTTIVECKKLGIPSVGIEANPMAFFASTVKTDWTPSPEAMRKDASAIASATIEELSASDIADESFFQRRTSHGSLRDFTAEENKVVLTNSISPLPLHKSLTLLKQISSRADSKFTCHEQLALAKAVVESASNLHFGPEVGVGMIKEDAAVVNPWLYNMGRIADDLQLVRHNKHVPSSCLLGDARNLRRLVRENSVDFVFTSPPYPNEKDYTRTTRLESVLLGFIKSKADLRQLKQTLIRSNTRTVYKGDDDDDAIKAFPEIQRIAREIEERRIELGKDSGFERQYHRVAKLYFGGMARHLRDLQYVLKPGAVLAYVVGDQASFLRVMIRTGQLLADIAQSMGYELIGIDLFRTRLATATKEQLREEVVVLQWKGK